MSRTTVRGGPSGGYLSLTGPGEGATPGALTQEGGLTVNGGSEPIFLITSTGLAYFGVGFTTLQVAGDGIALVAEQLGFFNQSPISQPAAPSTLAEVISALQDLGLVAF